MDLRKGFVCLSVLGLFLMYGTHANAIERGVDLKVAAQQEYNDNIFWSVDDEIDDTISTLAGGLTYYNRTERANVDISARVEWLSYQDNEELDATDQFYKGKASYLFSPRWRGGVNAGFSKDSRVDRDINTTGLVLGTAERDRTDYGGFTTFHASEKTSVSLSYSYNDEKYDQDAFSDMVGHQAGLGIKHDWSKVLDNSSLLFNVNYGRYEYDTVDVSLYSGTMGLEKRISELWRFFLSVGVNHQETEFKVPGLVETKSDNQGSVWQVGLNYKGEYSRFGLTGKHDFAPASGFDGTTERTSIVLDWFYRFAQKSGMGLNINYYLNDSEAGDLSTEDIEDETIHISPRLRLNLFYDLYFVAKYNYSQVDDRLSDETISRRYVIFQLLYDVALWD